MKRFIITSLLVMFVLIGAGSAAFWDLGKIMEGKMMNPVGAPWIGDDQKMYFGNGKDVSISYDETTDDRGELGGFWSFTGVYGGQVAEISAALTTYTVSTLPQLILADSDSNNVTVRLPDAATVKGVPIIIEMSTAPGTYYTRINATGGDLINGLAMYGGTGNQYDKVILMSNASTTYADYYLIDSTGTWESCKD